MKVPPRFQLEFFLKKNNDELQTYASVFHERIATAFDGLETEAERIQHEEYERLVGSNEGHDEDDSAYPVYRLPPTPARRERVG